ncbi:MAG: hypothetical protein HFF79_04575 [Oscillospiraceae bacterium]|jgi:hypothetical protein|nr:hypothetical protein [Oscillospiraceae bacterium]
MKKNFTAMLPYLLVLAADFYLLPLLMRDTGGAMVMMLCVMPVIAFVCGIIHGVCEGFCVLLPLAALVLFVPTVFIHYNATAWVYAPVYAGIVLAGMGVGRIFYRKR